MPDNSENEILVNMTVMLLYTARETRNVTLALRFRLCLIERSLIKPA